MNSKLVLMQKAGRCASQEEYEDWKAGQEAIKDVTGFQYSFYAPSKGTITAFYEFESIYGLKRGQMAVYQ